MMELIKLLGCKFKLKASTLCQITNANKAMSYKKMGVERIVLDEAVNRDFQTMKDIRNAFGEGMDIIVNVVYHKNCIYRMFHQNQVSHDKEADRTSVACYSHKCMMKRAEEVGNLMKLNWVRPDDLHFYTEIGINYFKIQERQAVMKGHPLRTVESYFKEDYSGNLMELLDSFSPTNAFVHI